MDDLNIVPQDFQYVWNDCIINPDEPLLSNASFPGQELMSYSSPDLEPVSSSGQQMFDNSSLYADQGTSFNVSTIEVCDSSVATATSSSLPVDKAGGCSVGTSSTFPIVGFENSSLYADRGISFNFPTIELDNTSLYADQGTSFSLPTIEVCDSSVAAVTSSSLSVDEAGGSSVGTSSTSIVENICANIEVPEGSSNYFESPINSVLASKNWPGVCGFDVSLEENFSHGAKWTYSSKLDKLYIKRNAPCAIMIHTKQPVPRNAKIRAMPMFENPQYASDVVERCYHHFQEDTNNNIPFANHLIKSVSQQAVYNEDPVTKRLSVIVQYESPQSGEQHSTYVFVCTCLGSCPGGLNRRAVKLIFTLEHEGRPIGRRSIGLRICACPMRDRKHDEERIDITNIKEEQTSKKKKSTKRKCPISSDEEENGLMSSVLGVSGHSSGSSKSSTPRNPPYNIPVYDVKMFNFLIQMQKFYLIHGTLHNLSPRKRESLFKHLKSSSESSAED